MDKPAVLPRIRISMLLLVIVPWAIVIVASFRIWLLPRTPAYEARDMAELQAIVRALDGYAAMYGEYPPDFTSGDPLREINQHLQKIFPERDANRDIPANIDKLGPENALAFWLGGFYDSNSKCPLTGKIYLGLDPENDEEVWIEMPAGGVLAEVYDGDAFSVLTSKGIIPVDGLVDRSDYEKLISNYTDLLGRKKETLDTLLRQSPLFDFDTARLSFLESYRPRCCRAPLIYFRAGNDADARFRDNPRWGTAMPYQTELEDGRKSFVAPFQIICAGRDNYYGKSSIAIGDAAYYQGHADNFTSFADEPLGLRKVMAEKQQALRARTLSLLAAILCTLAYPVSFLLDRKESGMVALSRITNKQVRAMDCSDQWSERLASQRHRRRSRALRRFHTKSKRFN